MKRPLTITALGLVALAVGCGGNGSSTSNDEAIEAAASDNITQVRAEQELTWALDGTPGDVSAIDYKAPGASNPCSVLLILTTPEEIALYEDSGDTILKTPDGAVGVKITAVGGEESACMSRADEALQELDLED